MNLEPDTIVQLVTVVVGTLSVLLGIWTGFKTKLAVLETKLEQMEREFKLLYDSVDELKSDIKSLLMSKLK